jgi:hypothetical protein
MDRRTTLSALAFITTAASARPLQAQTERWLEPLATPPRAAGTCVSVAPSSVPGTTVRHRLVMVSVTPGRRREMTVSLDAAGRPRGYNEMSFAPTGVASTNGESVFAMIDMQGTARGSRTHIATKITDSMPARRDTAALRRWIGEKRHSVSNTTTEPLDGPTQRTVVELAKWLASRCR